ncbi:MAG: hypothetical protein O7B79_12890, partial [SAR324 cluster bacterium]|nr:hypothetical protein [SAR324 cluster bacterium]
LIPIYAGIFALVLYVLFLSGILQGSLFPHFSIPPFGESPTPAEIINFLRSTYPSTGEDLAKLLFWTFVAGFSERCPGMTPQARSGKSWLMQIRIPPKNERQKQFFQRPILKRPFQERKPLAIGDGAGCSTRFGQKHPKKGLLDKMDKIF